MFASFNAVAPSRLPDHPLLQQPQTLGRREAKRRPGNGLVAAIRSDEDGSGPFFGRVLICFLSVFI